MYHNPALQRPTDEQERLTRPVGDSMAGEQQSNPVQTSYSPLPLQPAFNNRNPPQSPQATPLPPISTAVYGRETKYYDPTQDSGDRNDMARSGGQYDGYPVEVCKSHTATPLLFYYAIVDWPILMCDQQRLDNYAYSQPYHSPVAAAFPQPPAIGPPQQLSHPYSSSRGDGLSQSPLSPKLYPPYTRGPPPPVQTAHNMKQPQMQEVGEGSGNRATPAANKGQISTRTADPMSLSSIVSSNDHDTIPSKPPFESRRPSKPSNAYPTFKQEHAASPPPLGSLQSSFHLPKGLEVAMQNGIGTHPPAIHTTTARLRFRPDEKEVEAEMANIDLVDTGKVAMPSEWKDEYTQRNLKRMLIVQTTETGKRKVRKSITTSISSRHLLTVPAPSALLHPA